jgi:hypothetical protein
MPGEVFSVLSSFSPQRDAVAKGPSAETAEARLEKRGTTAFLGEANFFPGQGILWPSGAPCIRSFLQNRLPGRFVETH